MFNSRYVTSSIFVISSALGCSPTLNVPSIVDNTAGSGGEAVGGADASGGSRAKGGSSSKAGSSAKGGSGGRTNTSNSTGGIENNTGGTTNSGGSTPTDTSTSTSPNSGGNTATGGATNTGGTTATVPAPTISSLSVDFNKVCSGSQATITAVFANGTGLIDNGVGSITSGVAKAAPAVSTDTVYKLTVTNIAGASTTSSITVKAIPNGKFTPTGSMNVARQGHATTLLDDGRVLVVGGESTGSTEVYDLNTGTFKSNAKSPAGQLVWPQVVSLPNTKALITDHTTAWVVDVNTETFTAAGPFSATRSVHTVTWLPAISKTLVAGGCDSTDTLLQSTLLFNSASTPASAFYSGVTMLNARASHTATLLSSGKVLIAGGTNDCDDSGITSTSAAEIYDPTSGASGTITATGSMLTGRTYSSSIALPTGKALIVGGIQDYNFQYLSTAEVFDPSAGPSGQFSNTGSMNIARLRPNLVLLKNGNVFVVGGANSLVAELYRPATGDFMAIANTLTVVDPTPTILKNGAVLLSGGGTKTTSAFLYCP